MNLPMLVVDSDLEVSRREQAGWHARGIPTVRVDTMREGIERYNPKTWLQQRDKGKLDFGY